MAPRRRVFYDRTFSARMAPPPDELQQSSVLWKTAAGDQTTPFADICVERKQKDQSATVLHNGRAGKCQAFVDNLPSASHWAR